MVWTAAQTSTTLTLTPDGTSSANLAAVLDAAITSLGASAGVTKPSPNVYDATKKIVIATDASSNWLYVSGLTLIVRDQFIRNSGSRVRFTPKNVAGTVIGAPTIVLFVGSSNDYTITNAAFTVTNSNSLLEADDLTILYRDQTGSRTGSIVGGYDIVCNSASSWLNTSFYADNKNSDPICYLDNGTYTNCRFSGWGVCELSATSLVKGVVFDAVQTKNYLSPSYLEACTLNEIYNANTFNITDCSYTSLLINTAVSGNDIVLRNSLELLGDTTEANGLFVVRTTSNNQVYKRTFSGTGKITGGNAIGGTTATNSSERLLILATIYARSTITFNPDYRGTWEGVFAKYGRLPSVFSFSITGINTGKQSIPFASAQDLDITTAVSATVAAYTEFTITHSTGTVAIGAATTTRRLHDYSALEKASFADSGVTTGSNPVPKCCLPGLGTVIYKRSTSDFLYDLSLAANVTGVEGLTLAANKNVTLTVIGDYSTSIVTMGTGGIVTVPSGASNLQKWVGAGNTVNAASGTATVTVDNLAQWVAGTGVTLVLPGVTLTVATIAGASISLRKSSDNTLITSGTADGSGNFSTSYSGGAVSAVLRVRKAGHIPFQGTVSVTTAGLNASAVLAADNNYNPSY